MDRGWKPSVEMTPSCPRCGSSHTKFCYYNNYSLTQPRYFCKGCRRYWTKGGSLRNVPVGGGCRKNRRSGSSNNKSSLRLPSNNEGIVHSRSLDDLLVTKHPYDQDHDRPRSDGDDYHHDHLSSSSSHIDLAAVFANYLNPNPDSNLSGFHEFPSEFDPSALEFTDLEESNNLCDNEVQFVNYHPDHHQVGSTLHKHQDGNKAPQSFSSDTDQYPTLIGPSIFSNISDDDGLPPLPADDHHLEAVSDQEILWPDDDDHSFQMIDQQPLIGPESHQDPPDHLLFGNWSPFQFSR